MLPPEHNLSLHHPAWSLPHLLEAFGPLIFPIHRACLLRKRILITAHAPVEETCNFGGWHHYISQPSLTDSPSIRSFRSLKYTPRRQRPPSSHRPSSKTPTPLLNRRPRHPPPRRRPPRLQSSRLNPRIRTRASRRTRQRLDSLHNRQHPRHEKHALRRPDNHAPNLLGRRPRESMAKSRIPAGNRNESHATRSAPISSPPLGTFTTRLTPRKSESQPAKKLLSINLRV